VGQDSVLGGEAKITSVTEVNECQDGMYLGEILVE
jgi:hypothetical protein